MSEKNRQIFYFEDSPDHTIEDVEGVGYDRAVKAVRSPRGAYKRFNLSAAPKQEGLLARIKAFLAGTVQKVIVGIIVAIAVAAVVGYLGWK